MIFHENEYVEVIKNISLSGADTNYSGIIEKGTRGLIKNISERDDLYTVHLDSGPIVLLDKKSLKKVEEFIPSKKNTDNGSKSAYPDPKMLNESGLTKREEFASRNVAGLLSNANFPLQAERICEDALFAADTLLKYLDEN